MRCGNCKDNHASVGEVRACYGARASQPYPVRPAPGRPTVTTALPAVRASATGAPAVLDLSTVPVGTRDQRGHYAVRLGDELRFLRVDKPASGKWAGWTFVKLEVSEQTFPIASILPDNVVRWKTPALAPALLAVVADPQNAALLYGELFTRCALCNVRLTKPESVARKIGPICAGNVGW